MVYVYYYILLIPEFRSVNLCISILQPGFQYPRAYTGVGGGQFGISALHKTLKIPYLPKFYKKSCVPLTFPHIRQLSPFLCEIISPSRLNIFPHQFNVTILFSETFIQGVPINMEFSDEFDIVFMNNSLI